MVSGIDLIDLYFHSHLPVRDFSESCLLFYELSRKFEYFFVSHQSSRIDCRDGDEGEDGEAL